MKMRCDINWVLHKENLKQKCHRTILSDLIICKKIIPLSITPNRFLIICKFQQNIFLYTTILKKSMANIYILINSFKSFLFVLVQIKAQEPMYTKLNFEFYHPKKPMISETIFSQEFWIFLSFL